MEELHRRLQQSPALTASLQVVVPLALPLSLLQPMPLVSPLAAQGMSAPQPPVVVRPQLHPLPPGAQGKVQQVQTGKFLWGPLVSLLPSVLPMHLHLEGAKM